MNFICRISIAVVSLTMIGCVNMKLDRVSKSSPEFKFEEYFLGHTKASGWFSDRFSNVKRHFCGDFFGEFVDEKFVLTETLFYTDDIVENRVWNITLNDAGFIARSDSLVGDAIAKSDGNAMQILYKMRVLIAEDKEWVLGMNDWFFYQPDGSLHNSTIVAKWGVRIGSVSTQYTKHEGELSCHSSSQPEK